jgi:hypothetical protein
VTNDTASSPGPEPDRPASEPLPAYGNPAGCAQAVPADLNPSAMLAKVQADLGGGINLAERRQTYIWNGPQGTMLDVTQDPFVYEFEFNEYQHPLTYLGDRVATTFLVNGFTVWFREYKGAFRLMAVPMAPGVLASPWAGYVTAYWQPGGQPVDETIYPVMKKLPCQWVTRSGYVSEETLKVMFPLNWNLPDYLTAGRQYLAQDCHEANRISQEVIGYWDAASMCGPLAWRIIKDVNGYPYRIGSWYANDLIFVGANPKFTGQPWASFDPETYDLARSDTPLPGYDFNSRGNLQPGDIVYSYSTMYEQENEQHFDHIFLVAGIGPDQSRLSVSNMVQNSPHKDCSISEVVLYTPGNRETGVVNHEWNGFGFGKTGGTGFDVFRWKWITYHVNGQPMHYTIRLGDTIETIAFDWKIDPASLLQANNFQPGVQLQPGQVIQLPVPASFPVYGNTEVAFQTRP